MQIKTRKPDAGAENKAFSPDKPSEKIPSSYGDRDFYFPEFAYILEKCGVSRDDLKSGAVSIPASFFKELLTIAVSRQYFDEQAYLKDNPDVEQAFKAQKIKDAHEHYFNNGWFEGRNPGTYHVDQDWYAKFYKDIGRAQKGGRIESMFQHFKSTGRREGRAGSFKQLQWKQLWDRALTGKV